MDGRIVVIGIDGATWDLLDEYIDDGVMPNLAELRETGMSGVLESTVPPASLPAWPSMVTGQNPGKHGIFDLGGPLEVADPGPVYKRGPWHVLEGARMAFINVPGTYPLVEHGIDGYVVSGMFTPAGEWEDMDAFTSPDGFADELDDVVDDYMIDLWLLDEGNLPERARRAVDNRTAITTYLLEEKDIDLLWTVFIAPDRLMHKFWAYQDDDHPLYDSVPEDSDKRDVLREHFAHIDENLGEIRERLDDDDYLLVLSDHGFQGSYRSIDLDGFLQENGYMEQTEERGKTVAARLGIHQKTAERLFTLLGGEIIVSRGSKRLRSWLKAVRQQLPSPGENVEVDHSKSRVLTGSSGRTLQVNVESQGGPVPDDERESVRDAVMADLEQFQKEHGLSGTVRPTDEVWSGPETGAIPDVYWFFDNVTDAGGDEALLTSIDRVTDGEGRTSTAWHHPEGIYVANGPGIGPGEQDESLYNVIPTLTALLEDVVPAEADGRVMGAFTGAVDEPDEKSVLREETDGIDI